MLNESRHNLWASPAAPQRVVAGHRACPPAHGLQPNMDVEIDFRDGELVLRAAGGKTHGQLLVERLRGTFSGAGRSSDEIMQETRGED